MAVKTVRVGTQADIIQFDDGDFSEAIDTDNMPIKIGQSAAADNAIRQDELSGAPADTVSSSANIGDNKAVRGDGGAKAVQDSDLTIKDGGDVSIPTGKGYQVNDIQVVTNQQAAESNAAAVSAISMTAGANTIDITTVDADLATLVTEINAIRTTLNNLLAKLRTHGLIDT